MKKLAIPLFASVATCITMVLQMMTPKTTVCEAPDVHLGEIAGFESEAVEPSEAELNVLPSDTRIDKRRYTSPDGHWYQVAVVIGGTSKSSIHRPELCLPSQGFLMTAPYDIEVGGLLWRAITLDGGNLRPSIGFAYTFFNQDGYHTASHTARIFRDIWDRSILNRIDRWVMVTVNTSRADRPGISAFLSKLRGTLP